MVLATAQTIYVTNRIGTTGLNMGRKLEVEKNPLRMFIWIKKSIDFTISKAASKVDDLECWTLFEV